MPECFLIPKSYSLHVPLATFCNKINFLIILVELWLGSYWGEPERAPHLLWQAIRFKIHLDTSNKKRLSI